MTQQDSAPALATPREAVSDAIERSAAACHSAALEKLSEAWMAAARLAPLLSLTDAREDDPSLRVAEVLDRSVHYFDIPVTDQCASCGGWWRRRGDLASDAPGPSWRNYCVNADLLQRRGAQASKR